MDTIPTPKPPTVEELKAIPTEHAVATSAGLLLYITQGLASHKSCCMKPEVYKAICLISARRLVAQLEGRYEDVITLHTEGEAYLGKLVAEVEGHVQ